jgi:NAD-dependent dihydropyrimidine dehydrogenase PreA subunit
MIRTVIQIDEELCTGCRLCVDACHEGAIGMVNGKARLLRDDYCDGLGDCLPACPTGAITFIEREAAPYDEEAVEKHLLERATEEGVTFDPAALPSRLMQWPLQIKLVPVQAPYYQGHGLLVAADCTAFACASFHERFMKNKVTIVGCPKLDEGSYAEKLTAIIASNDITDVTIARMEVPCCGGLERAAAEAVARSGKTIPFRTLTFSVKGELLG